MYLISTCNSIYKSVREHNALLGKVNVVVWVGGRLATSRTSLQLSSVVSEQQCTEGYQTIRVTSLLIYLMLSRADTNNIPCQLARTIPTPTLPSLDQHTSVYTERKIFENINEKYLAPYWQRFNFTLTAMLQLGMFPSSVKYQIWRGWVSLFIITNSNFTILNLEK